MRNVILNDAEGQDALTGLRSPTRYGRPNFDQIFAQVRRRPPENIRPDGVCSPCRCPSCRSLSGPQMAADHPSTDIGVFFCGPKVMSRALHRSCNKSTSTRKNGTKFFYHKENF